MKKSNASVIIIIAVLFSFICGGIGAYIIVNYDSNDEVITTSGTSIKLFETDSISESVKKVYDAVVVVEGITNNKIASTGTGFVYKQTDGLAYIMTNHHVVSGMQSVRVVLSNGNEVDAKVVGSEAYSDIAVLSVDAKKVISVAVLGDSEKSLVGDTVFTVGSPEGVEYAGTVTQGILSGKDRLVAVALSNSNTSDYYMKVLQTDAAINPGNSGGPICNTNGEVIGITNMKLVDSSVEGMGFAIPIEDALYYSAILEKGNNVERPYFGIGMLDLSDSYYLWQNGINIPKDLTEGVVISEVAKGSPAYKAGLKKGDIIISLGEEDIKSLAEFRYQLYKHKIGEEVKVKFIRNNKKQEVKVKLSKNNDKG